MGHIVFITPTYNRGKRLPKLYNSLKAQTFGDFRWLLVDDGSTDCTEEIASQFTAEQCVSMEYIRKPNSGKSSSLNLAFDKIEEDELAVIVDDDEELVPEAAEIAEAYYQRYYSTSIGCIHFQRRDVETGKVIANYDTSEDLRLDYRRFKAEGKNADGYIAYFGRAIRNLRFPVFSGEKYVGPGVMLMLCAEKNDMVWASAVIGTTEYMAGGITKQGRRLRVKNPVGMLLYCTLFQSPDIGEKTRWKYSVMGWAYYSIAEKSEQELSSLGIDTHQLIRAAKLPGALLAGYWKKKYL